MTSRIQTLITEHNRRGEVIGSAVRPIPKAATSSTMHPLPARWVDVLLTTPEPVLYAYLIAGALALRASSEGAVEVDLKALDRLLKARLKHPAKRSAGDVIFGIVTAGWLQVVDLDRMLFKLSAPGELGDVPHTSYAPADAVRSTQNHKGYRPRKLVKA